MDINVCHLNFRLKHLKNDKLLEGMERELWTGESMPVVEVKMWKGRSEEDKARIIEGITKVFVDFGIPADVVTIIIYEIPKHNWGSGGKACEH